MYELSEKKKGQTPCFGNTMKGNSNGGGEDGAMAPFSPVFEGPAVLEKYYFFAHSCGKS